ncbi:MAG TPA: phosphoribosyltransferase family protein [Candidatus Methylacidiphilales bacterium]|nr:phosphoribosyltransferase family protein [Candidatus Methylacidiphilales bacterium]
MIFQDRSEAGKLLARELAEFRGRKDVLLLALPRGGVSVGYEIAKSLGAPLDVLVVRKIGLPYCPEMAIGALTFDGIEMLSTEALSDLDVSASDLRRVIEAEREELDRRERIFRKNRPPLDARGKTVILVDDGLATGQSMRAAIACVCRHQPGEIVIAVPVGAPGSCQTLAESVSRVICLSKPFYFKAVGAFYRDFHQVTDEEAIGLLQKADAIHSHSL